MSLFVLLLLDLCLCHYWLYYFFTSAKEVMIIAVLSDCSQSYTKTTKPIVLKLTGRVGYGHEVSEQIQLRGRSRHIICH